MIVVTRDITSTIQTESIILSVGTDELRDY
jgi:hypothetical protein